MGRARRRTRAQSRAVVTGNVADFAAERDVVLVFVLKNSPAGGGPPPSQRLSTVKRLITRSRYRRTGSLDSILSSTVIHG